MQTTGQFAARVDQWLGLPYHTLDKMPVRDQREIVCINAVKMLRKQSKLYQRNQVRPTVPLDTEQNTELVKRKQERVFATLEHSVKGGSGEFNEGVTPEEQSPLTAPYTNYTRTLYTTKNRSAKLDQSLTPLFDGGLPEIMTPALKKKLSTDSDPPFMNTHLQKRGCERLLVQVGKDNDYQMQHSLK